MESSKGLEGENLHVLIRNFLLRPVSYNKCKARTFVSMLWSLFSQTFHLPSIHISQQNRIWICESWWYWFEDEPCEFVLDALVQVQSHAQAPQVGFKKRGARLK